MNDTIPRVFGSSIHTSDSDSEDCLPDGGTGDHTFKKKPNIERTPSYETVILPVNQSPEDVTAPNKLTRHLLDSKMLQSIKRQVTAKGQRPRIMAGVTMYNEDETELQYTM